MQIPALDEFRQESGTPPAMPWWVDVNDADFMLSIPDSWPEGEDGFGEPHEPSYRLALIVLPELESLKRKAVEYLAQIVDFGKMGIAGDPYLVHVNCDARKETVIVEMAWESDIYALWSVTFFWRERPEGTPRWVWPKAMGFSTR
ncbi:MAG TPA: hypothetical protein VFS20_08090 [Longimicrobium sp.]|nr:hypothetical protein [Longimicrobium sp.]